MLSKYRGKQLHNGASICFGKMDDTKIVRKKWTTKFRILSKITFLSKISFFVQNFVFDKNFDYFPKFQCLSQISSFVQYFVFVQNLVLKATLKKKNWTTTAQKIAGQQVLK